MSVDPTDDDLPEKLKGPVMALRIILVAMASGIVVFAVVFQRVARRRVGWAAAAPH